MKYFKENILSDIKQQSSYVAKANCSQLLIDCLKDQINSLPNEIQFLGDELKVKNHPLESSHPKKIDSSQQIGQHTEKISDEKRYCSININGNNNITIKQLTQNYNVEIPFESRNNNNIAKDKAREERAISTNTAEINKDMCDIQNNIVVDYIKNDDKKVNSNQLYHNFSKGTRQGNDSQFNACTKNSSNKGNTQQQQEKISRPRKSAFILGDSMIKKSKWLRPFVTAKTDDMYDHIKPTQGDF